MPIVPQKKHLKLRGTWLPSEEKVEVRVIEQSHFSADFGNTRPTHYWDTDNNFKTSDVPRYAIMSHYATDPHRYTYENGEVWFLVAPTPAHVGTCTYKITKEDWEVLKQLVEAYNKWGESLGD